MTEFDWKKYCGLDSRVIVKRPAEQLVREQVEAHLEVMLGRRKIPNSVVAQNNPHLNFAFKIPKLPSLSLQGFQLHIDAAEKSISEAILGQQVDAKKKPSYAKWLHLPDRTLSVCWYGSNLFGTEGKVVSLDTGRVGAEIEVLWAHVSGMQTYRYEKSYWLYLILPSPIVHKNWVIPEVGMIVRTERGRLTIIKQAASTPYYFVAKDSINGLEHTFDLAAGGWLTKVWPDLSAEVG